MHPQDVRRIARQSRGIHGWLSPEAAALLGLLDAVQREHGVEGDLFEIGAHHGRSAVVLGALARPDETVGVCDVFGGQEANVSGSGAGDRAIFDRNMAALAPGARVAVFEKLSSQLTAAEIGGPVRIFHVDGGHLAEEALADLGLAAEVLHPSGAIVVDDAFRHEWPGVTEAIVRFGDERPDLEPVALGFNKLVLVPSAARGHYDAALASELLWSYVDRRAFSTKTLPVGGHDATIFFIPTARQIPGLEPAVARTRTLWAGVRRRVPVVRSS